MTFIAQTFRMAAYSASGLPFVGLLFGWRVAIGIAGGLGVALANIWVLQGLIQAMFRSGRTGIWTQVAWWVMKIPVIYGLAILLLVSSWSSPIGFLVGFSLWFGLLFASALRSTYA